MSRSKVKASKDLCPNCSKPLNEHTSTDCILAFLIGLVEERGQHTPSQLRQLTLKCDTDQLWSEVIPLVDRLAEGEFSS